MMEQIVYSKVYRIPVYDIGFDGRLSTHSLFNYLQDIASEHAVILKFGKDDLVRNNRFWVLSRIAADIKIWPGWEETVVVTTWPRGTDKLFALRDFEVRKEDGTLVATATSSWLVVDITSRRVQRPDSVLTAFNSEFPEKSSMGRNAGKVDAPESDIIKGKPFMVLPSDLDINHHVNNVMYLRWVMDSYDMDFLGTHLPSTVEINYLSESRSGDEITITRGKGNNDALTYNHSVTRAVDNTELCRVGITWKDCRQ